MCYYMTLIVLCVVAYHADGRSMKNKRYATEYNGSGTYGDAGAEYNDIVAGPTHSEPRRSQSQPTVHPSPHCPVPCTCTLSEGIITEVDCSHTQLDNIPPGIPDTALKLVLSYNKLKEVSSNVFLNLTRLEFLDLSHNVITHVHDESFNGLSSVKFISLDFNKLETTDAYSEHALLPLRKIKELHIQGNCNKDKSTCDYPKRVMRDITSLEKLYQDGYPIRKLPIEYSALVNLRMLVISGQRLSGYCGIAHLSWDLLTSIEYLPINTLEISNCHVDTIQPFTFAKLRNLTTLILSSNQNLCGDGVKNLTAGLNSTNIKKLVLKETCNTFPGPLGKNNSMQYISNTKLEYLDISNSKIQYISPVNILLMPTTLKYLSLRCNDINDVMFLVVVPIMASLEYFDISFQSSFRNLEDTTNTMLCRGNVTIDQTSAGDYKSEHDNHSVEVAISQSMSELTIDKSHVDKLQYIKNISHPHWPTVIPLPPKLRTVFASHLKLESPVPPIAFNPYNVVENVDLSYNTLTGIEGMISGLHMLKYLDLSHNDIISIHKDAFGDMKNMRELNLGSNRLGQIVFLVEANFLVNQTKLEKLDMSSNGIKELPNDIFVSLKVLKYLYLKDNSLSGLNFRLDGMKELRLLDISFNRIKYLSATSMRMLDRITALGVLTMDIEHNILTCTCDHQDFMKWLTSYSVDILSRNNVTCMTSNSSSMTLLQLDNSYEELQLECYTWLLLTCCIVGFIVLTIILSLSAALYKQRWKLRYLYYIGRRRINPYHPIEEDESSETRYDIYFSFDESFNLPSNRSLYDVITTSLYPQLTEHNVSTIMRHHLDDGKMFHDIISAAIRQSDKVVVLLASKYCKEFWNTFEFNMAAYEGIYAKRKVIIPVLMETVEERDMTPEIWAYCRNQRMLMFNEDQVDEFVDVLVNSLRDP